VCVLGGGGLVVAGAAVLCEACLCGRWVFSKDKTREHLTQGGSVCALGEGGGAG
jgi:hypothetical protein